VLCACCRALNTNDHSAPDEELISSAFLSGADAADSMLHCLNGNEGDCSIRRERHCVTVYFSVYSISAMEQD
jgi:hypothetical protein